MSHRCLLQPGHQQSGLNWNDTTSWFNMRVEVNCISTGHSSGMDNRGIVDDGTSQTLTHDDISVMKEQGVTGQVCC